MRIQTTNDMGHLIRARRTERGLTQDQLAEMVGASRKWVSDIEGGKVTSEVGRVLKVLAALGVVLVTDRGNALVQAQPEEEETLPDLNAHLDRYARGPG